MNSRFMMTALIYVAFIVIMLLPMFISNSKKRKRHTALMESLKIGSKIVTIGGIHGSITRILETSVEIKIDKGVTMLMDKNAISRVENEN